MASRFGSRCAPMPLTSPPEQNAVPAPVINSAPTSGFSPQALIMLRSAGVNRSDSALRTSGRFSVITATRSRIAQSSSSVPVSTLVSVVVMSKLLHPWPQFQLPGPGAARLLQYIPVAQGDRIGIEERVGPVGRIGPGRTADATIDHEMRDMNALRRQLARHALRQPAQRKLAHRERR